jgi:hypothetical protein
VSKLSADQLSIVDALERLPSKERAQVIRSIGLGGPSQWVSDWIWFVIVLAFVATMAASVGVLLLGRFNLISPAENAIFTSTETLITLFTTTTAFLAGLLSPSPVKGQGGE